MPNALTPLFEHNLWANLLLLEACRSLSEAQFDLTEAGVYGTPASTFVHYLSGEQSYIFRLTDEKRALPNDAPWPGVAVLAEHARRSGQRLLELAEVVGPGDTCHSHFGGADYQIDSHLVLVQAINHSTEHRAHIVTTLSAHGKSLPEIDGWRWGEATGRLRPMPG